MKMSIKEKHHEKGEDKKHHAHREKMMEKMGKMAEKMHEMHKEYKGKDGVKKKISRKIYQCTLVL